MSDRATKIKFCGITREQDAELAVSLDAWAVGMILWPGSRRYVAPERAAELAAPLRRRIEIAGVFVNPTLDDLTAIAELVGLTLIQLHGQEGPVFCSEVARRTGCRVIKAARVRSGADVQALAQFHTDLHLLDSYVEGVPGGTGESFNWELARTAARGRRRGAAVPLILSGGLRPVNVAEAIAKVHPYAVDVASGVEIAPGLKDEGLMRAFRDAVDAANAGSQPAPADPQPIAAPSGEPQAVSPDPEPVEA